MTEHLQRTIDEQRSQLENYEKKLKDVVTAYKSLQVEKEALQVALSAISGDKPEDESQEGSESEPRNEIESLKQAITTLTKENKKKEMAYQADKRLLLSKNEKLQTMVDSITAMNAKSKDLPKYVEKIRRLEEDKEKLLADHGAMLNNMQKRYAEEVTKVKKCEQTISNLYKQIHEKDQQLQANSTIINQFEKVQDEMLRWKKQAEHTPRESILLHQLEELKKSHKEELELERNRRSASKNVDENKEGRIFELEQRVEALMGQIASLEHDRANLKEQLEETEKREVSNSSNSIHDVIPRKNLKLVFVKTYEKLKAAEDFDVYNVLSLERPSVPQQALEYNNQVTKTTTNCDKCTESYKELQYFKSVINHLQNQVKVLEDNHEQTRKTHEDVAKSLRNRIVELEESQEKTYTDLTSETKRKVTELEQEIQKQRERMITVIEEKNREIEIVKQTIDEMRKTHCHDPVDPSPDLFNSSADNMRAVMNSSFDEDTFASHATRKRSNGQFGEFRNVYYEEEIRKYEQEISELRNVLRLSELKIGDIEQASLTKDMQYLQIIEALKEEVRVLEGKLNLQKADTNMEYLRNIFVQFLNSSSASSRKCVLRAIALILRLTPNEMKKVEKWNI
ncbi:unnamed protein product [Bursaphelenchus xylophilus]|uniref:(pine wood nematode) hypothetical protein n=1 Tax=Bursaphelenchus xylophilus TaxID=6326 RepID=A0A1I7RQW3_BURXY|nr:unnamed protein product [Bursaphelenchus xylophilus]CAG9130711.1 unnamed protein product [Bursaphelenchus xylophilus]